MKDQEKLPADFSVEELDRELLARGAQIPGDQLFKFVGTEGTPEQNRIMTGVKELHKRAPHPNESLADISTWDITKTLIFKTSSTMDFVRGSWSDDLMDCDEITDEQVDKNAGCVAMICMDKDLNNTNNGISILNTRNYGETFNLCEIEPFRNQPAAAGPMCTGFLVANDVVATAGHLPDEQNVTDLRILFGYKMLDSLTPVTRFSNESIYRGVEFIGRVHKNVANVSDWSLIKLDRNVVGQTVAALSKENISFKQAVYVMGNPLGLPLKFVKGASVRNVHDNYFEANLNIYSSSSGSPVFDFQTHEVIGIVARADNCDFRWVGNGFMSVNNPNSKRADCTRVSEFIDILR
jgi:V8-like Glu-specific endopeptidase